LIFFNRHDDVSVKNIIFVKSSYKHSAIIRYALVIIIIIILLLFDSNDLNLKKMATNKSESVTGKLVENAEYIYKLMRSELTRIGSAAGCPSSHMFFIFGASVRLFVCIYTIEKFSFGFREI